MSCTSSGSKCDASSLYSTSSQNSVVTWRRSKIGGWPAAGAGAGLPDSIERFSAAASLPIASSKRRR